MNDYNKPMSDAVEPEQLTDWVSLDTQVLCMLFNDVVSKWNGYRVEWNKRVVMLGEFERKPSWSLLNYYACPEFISKSVINFKPELRCPSKHAQRDQEYVRLTSTPRFRFQGNRHNVIISVCVVHVCETETEKQQDSSPEQSIMHYYRILHQIIWIKRKFDEILPSIECFSLSSMTTRGKKN